MAALPGGGDGLGVVIGDFNVLEPTHMPRYRFFLPFEYAFYEWLGEVGYVDAFRRLHTEALEYSWVGRTGDGYRYDHAHVSAGLANALRSCAYVHDVHDVRTAADRLTDHSALSMSMSMSPAVQPARLLTVTEPVRADAGVAPALF